MTPDDIRSFILCLVEIPDRLRQVVLGYLMMLMVEAPRHSMSLAAELSGLDVAQFSRLLSGHGDLAKATLQGVAAHAGKRAGAARTPLVKGAKWTVALIVDAMIHERSSLHVQNVQRFNHGQGFKIGHQWTNVILYVGGKTIALPPIPFYSRAECRRRGIAYKTAPERLQEYIKELALARYIGPYDPNEILVLADSGYDIKVIERLILEQGWDFIVSLRGQRCVRSSIHENSNTQPWRSVTDLFWATRKQAPWKTVRMKRDGKRRRRFRARKLTGHLKGIKTREMAIVCSEKSKGEGRRYLACSRAETSVSMIVQLYRIRWQIELFHRAAKQQFGAEDTAAHTFDATEAHISWVYCAHTLVQVMEVEGAKSLIEKQRTLSAAIRSASLVSLVGKVSQLRTCFGGKRKAKELVAAAARGRLVA